MKILHIVQSLDPAWGGIARVLPELAATLVQAGDECHIATLVGDRFGTAPEVPGVTVHRFAGKKGSRLGGSTEFNRNIRSLVKAVDVVHLHGLWTDQNWKAGRAARKIGKPFIMTPHSHMMPWAWERSWWKKRPIGWLFEHRNLRHAACLHALAEGEAEHMRALGFNPRITVIPNGIHAAEYAQTPAPDALIARYPTWKNRRWLVFLGRIHTQKGIVPAMQACFDVAALAAGEAGGQDWHLILAGPDEVGLQSKLAAAAQRKGLADRITFTGMLSREDVRAALGRATLLLQPSLSEGLSMSILEAMATGVPVLISPACNLPEVKESDAGRVVDPSRRSISAALRELISMPPEKLAEMGRRGQSLVRERFEWRILTPRYREMYRQAIKTTEATPLIENRS